jgi:hypothetical protein
MTSRKQFQAKEPSRRDRVREAAEFLLRARKEPLHNTEIAVAILPDLGLSGEMSPKDVNTTLHEDPQSRFESAGRGMWRINRSWR